MVKTVYILFKTHLDIGFTDFSAAVTEKYLKEYIPGAIRLGYALKDTDTPFVWTTGSWLIHEALKTDGGALDRAIRDGLIRWHALPFTTHTELMTPYAFEAGLAMSDELNARFGVTTAGAKMTDVPGHTAGIVPLLAKHGVKLLHIGVNEATPMPRVPERFRWRCGDSEITVIYNDGGYGGDIVNGENAFVFAHTLDNLGPQDPEAVRAAYREAAVRYPGARLTAGTLEDLAETFDPAGLPVIENEIGDSWIHGIGTDPWKTSACRALQRYAEQNRLPVPEPLLLAPEHTWGLDIKTHYANVTDWTLEAFSKTEGDPRRKKAEAAWEEQRDYLRRAAQELGADLDREMACEKPDLTGFEPAPVTPPPCKVEFQLFGGADYRRYIGTYLRPPLIEWKFQDFTKIGLPEYPGYTAEAVPAAAWKKGDTTVWELRFPADKEREQGLPVIWAIGGPGSLELRWFGKRPNRLPQAFWVSFPFFTGPAGVRKMGRTVDLSDALGSPLISGFDDLVENDRYVLTALDAPLVAPFGKHLLEYGLPDLRPDLHFNLYNNIWGTNFPVWYGDDARFRFSWREKG